MMRSIMMLSLLVLSFTVSAEYLIKGVGGLSCERYLSDYKNTRVARQIHRSWIMGFITGMNFKDENIKNRGEGVNAERIDDWIINYCEENPQDKLHAAVEMYCMELENDLANQIER